ncbi:MAG: YigZ family protein [Rhodothermales bacterium]
MGPSDLRSQHDTYRTIKTYTEAEVKIKGSRFIGRAFPAASSEEAEAEIQTLRKAEYTATHHCSAYRVGVRGDTFRYNDDGEPSGTAGPPILRQIDKLELTKVLVVVTRYYGGTKLGTGGLIRAYGEAAALVLDAAAIDERILRDTVVVRFAYADTSPAMHAIGQVDAQIVDTAYGDDTAITLAIRQRDTTLFIEAFTQALHGRGTVRHRV